MELFLSFHCVTLGFQLPILAHDFSFLSNLLGPFTIHKSQGLTLEKGVIDVGKKEFSSGLTFVACSRVRHLRDILFISPFTYQRIANVGKGNQLKERRDGDSRLERMCADQPKPTVKDIPINCLFLEAESNHLAVSDIIEPANEEPHVCPLKYYPVDDNWQRMTMRRCDDRYQQLVKGHVHLI